MENGRISRKPREARGARYMVIGDMYQVGVQTAQERLPGRLVGDRGRFRLRK